jgi:predicted site-specific integrase-resolvase
MEIPTLTQQEALARLGVTYKTLQRLEKRKKVRVVRISRKVVRYFESDISLVQSEVKEVKDK